MTHLSIPVKNAGDIYGYSVIIVALTESNKIELGKLRTLFELTEAMDKRVSQIVMFNTSLDFEVLTTEYPFPNQVDEDNDFVGEFKDEDIQEDRDVDNEYKLESPMIKVDGSQVNLIYPSKYTSDEIWGELNIETFLKEYAKL